LDDFFAIDEGLEKTTAFSFPAKTFFFGIPSPIFDGTRLAAGARYFCHERPDLGGLISSLSISVVWCNNDRASPKIRDDLEVAEESPIQVEECCDSSCCDPLIGSGFSLCSSLALATGSLTRGVWPWENKFCNSYGQDGVDDKGCESYRETLAKVAI